MIPHIKPYENAFKDKKPIYLP